MNDAPPDHFIDDFQGFNARNQTLCLFLASVIGLFLELVLIRWISTEIRIFAYLQNTVLVVCFLGLGIGMLSCRKPISIREMLLPLGMLMVLLALPPSRLTLSRISEMLSVWDDLLIWSPGVRRGPWHGLLAFGSGLALSLIPMVLIWETFVPLGRLTGRLLADHPHTLWAYSVNILGGLFGVWIFVGLSALNQPPAAWFLVFSLLMAALTLASAPASRWVPTLVALGLLVPLAWLASREPGAMEVRWSPYQKLALMPTNPNDPAVGGLGEYLVTVNRVGYQGMIDLSERHVAANPGRYPPELRGLSQYDLPFLLHRAPRRALIVGAGTGNDVAGALRHGVAEVTAVEIDPDILDLGRRYHPERPYDSPRVRVVNDDARSYFAACPERFDVILFGLLDSHTTNAMTNARLDHYVYTMESLRHARSLLADGGIMVLSFEAQKPYVSDRMASALRQVFGAEPMSVRIPQTQYGWGGSMFVAGNLEGVHRQLADAPRVAAQIARWQAENPLTLTGQTLIATDDWPYIYLESPRIPSLYLCLAGLLAILFVHGVRRIGLAGLMNGWNVTRWHFFFMGAAFLLLEAQNISKASVVLGNTWQVNAVIISGILAMVLAANLIVATCPRLPQSAVYAALLLACLALYAFDLARLAFLPPWLKAPIVGALAGLPMLFSGILFARSFSAVADKDLALGANLFGALVGGLLQSVTFVTGTRFLLLIVAAFYAAAYLTRPAATKPDHEPATPPHPRTRHGDQRAPRSLPTVFSSSDT